MIFALLGNWSRSRLGSLFTGHESMDDAQVDGYLKVVSSRISGPTAAQYMAENQIVEAGRPLVDLDTSEQRVVYSIHNKRKVIIAEVSLRHLDRLES
jgi:multidrug resistance efflux pump